MEAGQEFDIPLNGSAWNYLGTEGRDGILFLKRHYEPGRIVFRFRAIVPGEYLLEFSREDVLVDEAETRWVAVIVEAPGSGRTGMALPSPSPASTTFPGSSVSPGSGLGASLAATPGSASSATGIVESAGSSTSSASMGGTSGTSASTETATGMAALGEAGALAFLNAELEAKRYESARGMAKEFALLYPESEEYLWLSARAAEAPGPGRDILLSLSLYQRIVKDFPEGKRRKAAGERAEWIKRSFIEIR